MMKRNNSSIKMNERTIKLIEAIMSKAIRDNSELLKELGKY